MAVYIALEGIDGCGKSTQARLLVDRLNEANKDNPPILIREPTVNTSLGNIIHEEKNFRNQQRDRKFDDQLWASLFEADRLMQQFLLHNYFQAADQIIISDRSAISALVYQGFFSRAIFPNLVIFIDVPPEIAGKRIKNKDVFEASLDQQRKYYQNYRLLLEGRENEIVPHLFLFNDVKFARVDGLLSKDVISDKIWDIVQRELNFSRK